MYATLGEITYEGVYGPSSFESSLTANYAEHALIEGKPRLQKIGENLEDLTLDISLRAAFCDPEAELNKLYRYLASGEVLPLVFGNGGVYGYFVLAGISVSMRKQTSRGYIIHVTASINLKEVSNPDPQTTARANAVAAARNNPTPTAQYTRQQGAPGQFTLEIVAAQAETVAVDNALTQAANAPELEASALQTASDSLDRQSASLAVADAAANDSTNPIYAAAAAFRAVSASILAANSQMKLAVAAGLAPALAARSAYLSALGQLSSSTASVAALKAIRR